MISKRRKRYSQPQENLRQFSLNNSKGIDSSKAVTDVNTILHSKNLIVNPDGSLSLRKPIKEAGGIPLDKYRQADRVYYTHDPDLYIVQGTHYYDSNDDGKVEPYGGISIHNANGEQLEFTFKYTTVDGEEKTLRSNALTAYSGIDFSESKCIPLNTATVLSGVKLSDERMHISYSVPVYRYLQISKASDGTWEFRVVNPIPNRPSVSEDVSAPLDVNLLLDVPYALQDTFFATYPQIRGIYMYAPAVMQHGVLTPFKPESSEEASTLIPTMRSLSEKKFTEGSSGYAMVSSLKPLTTSFNVIRAICDIASVPGDAGTFVSCAWFGTYNGVDWNNLTPSASDRVIKVREPTYGSDGKVNGYTTEQYVQLDYSPPSDLGIAWYDTPPFDSEFSPLTSVAIGDVGYRQYKFKIILPEKLEDGAPELEGVFDAGTYFRSSIVYGTALYTVPNSEFTEFAETMLPNASIGSKLYYNSAIFTYGTEGLGTNILVSNPGEFTTPISNTIDVLGAVGSYVTTLVPWRDYLMSATQRALYLHVRQDLGWITKTVTTATGIPVEDAKCCMAVLNGVIFKSGSRLYQLYPNLYSGSDTMLNLTELSKPVEDILIEHPGDGTQFAFSTESEYILMLPDDTETHCLRYNYSLKHWAYCTYPVKFYGFKMYNVDNVHLYGHVIADGVPIYTECVFDADVNEDEPYGDTVVENTVVDESFKVSTIPIPFSWDTGQKTDSISNTRQFVESKLMFATLSEQDAFPFKLYVAIDGDPHVITKDVSTDAPFWKPSDGNSLGVLNTNFRLGGEATPATGAFNTLRQLIVRYSGKGKSIRHVIEGKSLHNFKLYETYVRYKNLNIKQ